MRSTIRYPIGAVARLTGVPVETLRAWERRYQVVVPKREGGVRTYADSDVRKLRLLAALVRAGHAIGRLAALDERDLLALRTEGNEDGREVESKSQHPGVAMIWKPLERFDVEGAEAALEHLATLLPAEVLCLEVAVPLLRKVGDAWSEGHLGIAQEHLVSAALRSVLGSLTRIVRAPSGLRAPRVVFATPEGELHELGLAAGSLLAAAAHISPVYLGPNVPVRDVLDAVRWTEAKAVVLAVLSDRPGPLEAVSAIARGVPKATEVLVGGAPERLASELMPPARWIPDLETLTLELRRIVWPP